MNMWNKKGSQLNFVYHDSVIDRYRIIIGDISKDQMYYGAYETKSEAKKASYFVRKNFKQNLLKKVN